MRPVTKDRLPRLRDKDAAPPDKLPEGEQLERKLARALEQLAALQDKLYADARHALLVVLQARDTGGKDGTIRRVFSGCNPQGCQVTSFKAPTPAELAHDFLWRVHQAVPARGMIGIFNRSHYEDVLVVRVHDLVPRDVWKKRFDQINDFERMLTENGVTILKFYLHISKDEQRRRLLSRIDDPAKNWKFNHGDLDERERWDEYTRAYRDVFARCSTPWAPWFVVPADDKKARDYLVARQIVKTLSEMPLAYPEPHEDLQQYRASLVE